MKDTVEGFHYGGVLKELIETPCLSKSPRVWSSKRRIRSGILPGWQSYVLSSRITSPPVDLDRRD